MYLARTAFLAATFSALLSAAESPRETAVWALHQGGAVALDGSRTWISDLSRLPAGEMHVTGMNMSGTHIDPKDLERIGQLAELRELFLPGYMWNNSAGNRMDANEQLKHLAGLKHLVKLHLDIHFLTNINLQDKGIANLAPLTQLQELRLEQTRIKGRTLGTFVHLRALDMTYSMFDDEGMESLKGMPELERLYLRDTLVTDAGLQSIAGLKKLTELDLAGNRITDEGLGYLKDLVNLRELNLSAPRSRMRVWIRSPE